MSQNLKILIVDDTIFYRQLLSNLIEEIPDIDLMGVASNGKIALKKIELSPPDLVIMDMAMPEMDGLEALGQIKANHPGVNVIMLSGADKEAAALTVKALEKGALDFISKPKATSPDAAFEELKSELIPLITLAKTMKSSRETRRISGKNQLPTTINRISSNTHTPGTPNSKQIPASLLLPTSYTISDSSVKGHSEPTHSVSHVPDPNPPTTQPVAGGGGKKWDIKRIDVVVIGVSTGGPNTLKHIIPKICKEIPVPILTVQHMPPIFTASLAESLNRTSSITVVEGKAEEPLEKGTMYIAPGGRHMVVRKGADSIVRLGLVDTPPLHNCRPAVDVLFRSIAMVFGGNVLAVILTGMGHDGLSGVAAIRRKGGYSLAQDEKSSVVWGMPGAVVEAGEADEIYPEEQIADRIMELVKKSRNHN